MIVNRPLGHLKISSGDIRALEACVDYCISNSQHKYCTPLNLTKYVVSKKNKKLQKVINSSDLVIGDGLPIVWLSKKLGYTDVFRVTGIDLAQKIISNSREKGWKLFFWGASTENLEKAIKNLKGKFKDLIIVGSQNGYFASDDIVKIIRKVNLYQPDVLFLGLGMPQKEYLIDDFFDQLDVKFCLPVGGAFDVWANVKKRTPPILQKFGLEWLYRSYYDREKFFNIVKYGFIFLKDYYFQNHKQI
jgi:N-acetylglucosaminyldiphosphoundecaprenol N-acetyl-beta-D-mannosaminyltransferase